MMNDNINISKPNSIVSEMSGNSSSCISCITGTCDTLGVHDWLANIDIPVEQNPYHYVEVRFKNNRKDIFKNDNHLELNIGTVVAVEAPKGHDIGIVSLTGELVRLQMKKKNIVKDSEDILQIYRKARKNDIKKWEEAKAQEKDTMYKTVKIAADLGLQMKICDVEYQGDKTRATFYYTAEDRIDFRELIKVLADKFKIRIDMRQFGSRQETGRLGGIGSCGKELCCSTWLSDFKTVSTTAARYQQLSSNPVKLAGQCGKLKCCLRYELKMYIDAMNDFPKEEIVLKTEKGLAAHQKTDVFKRTMWYAYKKDPNKLIPVPVDKVIEIIEMNKKGIIPTKLYDKEDITTTQGKNYF